MSDLAHAISLHRAGRLAEAQAIYRRILAAEPDQAEANHLLGLIACQCGQLESAVELIARALSQQPDNAEYLINLGEVQRRLGRFPEAIAACRRATALVPQNPVAHYNLAVALAAGGGPAEQAIAAYRAALDLQPAFPEALNNLGLLLHMAGRDEEAATRLRQALALRPAHPEAENNLGLALWGLQQHAEALAAFTRATQLRPDFAAAHANRAFALRKMGQRQEALAAFDRAAELNPTSAEIHRDRAMALVEVGQIPAALAAARRAVMHAAPPQKADALHALGVVLAAAAKSDPQRLPEAVAAYEAALALRPGVPEWLFELANLQGETPPQAPDAYVAHLFDEYALKFEQHLVGQLNYRVPEELLAALRAAWARLQAPAGDLDMLDLGCGTGLCGALFRPHARSLTGVDLSANMIAAARRRRDAAGQPVYDRLVHGHILAALQPLEDALDLILAADVLIYVGALESFFAATTRALRRGGMLAFSLERPVEPGKDLVLHERYQHSLDYVRRLATEQGLTEITAQTCHLRNDVPPGWLIILQK